MSSYSPLLSMRSWLGAAEGGAKRRPSQAHSVCAPTFERLSAAPRMRPAAGEAHLGRVPSLPALCLPVS
jgi:hypothetical protein